MIYVPTIYCGKNMTFNITINSDSFNFFVYNGYKHNILISPNKYVFVL